MQKIVTFLWFDDQAEEAMNFYVSVFKNSKIRAVGEALPGRFEGPLRLAEGQVRPLVADHPNGTRPDAW